MEGTLVEVVWFGAPLYLASDEIDHRRIGDGSADVDLYCLSGHADHPVFVPKREFLFSVILSGVYAKIVIERTPTLAFSGPENVFIFITH